MSITEATVQKIAKLARIALPEAQQEQTAAQLNGIMKWIEQLNTVNTDGIAPMVGVEDRGLTLRPDVVNDGNQAEAVLANAPERAAGYFVVPKVVENEN